MILGVCGWLAQKQGWNETYIRISFIVGAFFFGIGITVYIILLIVKLLSK